MTKLFASIAIASMMAVYPVHAQEAQSAGESKIWDENKEMLEQQAQNREPGDDGDFQGKPVVKGPADWHGKVGSVSEGSATTGASSGEAGSDQDD
ncbi:hypothetical protein [Hyphomicrobium sp. CS1GBMeth3]|uniref:hypothetical protein n=1 Tax=Hyphomicrobium sp. CS1GBMeth3 TaxID=1892845 RepID=UPI0009319456|nr:hypothetical protein [Hyphomicrobium sp. CS1GBMeth3]